MEFWLSASLTRQTDVSLSKQPFTLPYATASPPHSYKEKARLVFSMLLYSQEHQASPPAQPASADTDPSAGHLRIVYVRKKRTRQPSSGSESVLPGWDQCSVLTLSSSRLKPLPARTFLWYLIVGHLTIGRMGPATGRGAMRRAFAWRAFLLEGGRGEPSRTPHFCQLRHSRAAS